MLSNSGRYLAIAISFFTVLSFQNCSPTGFEAIGADEFESLSVDAESASNTNSSGTPVKPPSQPSNPNNTSTPKAPAPTPVVTPAPSPAPSPAPADTWYVVNSRVTYAYPGQAAISSHTSSSFESTFPYSNKVHISTQTNRAVNQVDGLGVLIPRFTNRARSLEYCMSSSITGCSSSSKFKKATVTAGSTPMLIVVENFYNAYWTNGFGDFYLFVSVDGEQRSILVRHRGFLPKISSLGENNYREFYFSANNGPQAPSSALVPETPITSPLVYGFGCFRPTASDKGWMSYSHGDFGGGGGSGPCHYRALTEKQAREEAIRQHIEIYGDAPRIQITCGDTGLKVNAPTRCYAGVFTPALLQHPDFWTWTGFEGQALLPVGKDITLTLREAGIYSASLRARHHTNTKDVLSNTITLSGTNANYVAVPTSARVTIKCALAQVRLGERSECSLSTLAGVGFSQASTMVWRVNNSKSPLAVAAVNSALTSSSRFYFVASKVGTHQVHIEGIDTGGGLIKSNTVSVQVVP